MKLVVAILDSMYDWRGFTSASGRRQAPPYFIINKNNHSGKRLYKLLEHTNSRLLVTDACKELLTSATEHGTPDPVWLATNIRSIQRLAPIGLLLVCGKVAQETWVKARKGPLQMWSDYTNSVLEIPHPAARVVWTNEYLKQVQEDIERKLNV